MKMSWIRSSKSTAVLVLLIVSVAAVGTAAAVTTASTEAPEEAQVGEEVTVSVTLTDLYEDGNGAWTLNGSTELRNVSGWSVTKVQPNGNENTTTFEGQQAFQVRIASEENLDEVRLSITGDVPPVEAYSYRPPQEFVAAELSQVRGENVNDLETVAVHHYTNESRTASQAISEAEEAVNASDSSEARETLDSAISVYEGGTNFGEARNLAQEAQDEAESAQQSAQTTQTLLIVGGVVVLLLVIGGGFYYYRSQQDEYDKLR